jgi:hypothetical protein
MLELSVRDGDTLIGLSDRYLARPADWPKLQRLNRVADPKRLQPGSTIRIPVAWLREEVDRAEVLSVAGNVTGADGSRLAVGNKLGAGAAVRTGADGFATLRTPDGSLIAVQPKSEVRITGLGRYVNTDAFSTLLRMVSGRVEAVVDKLRGPSRFEVQTDLAVAGVRGTRFRVASEAQDGAAKPRSRTEVLEGAVAFVPSGAKAVSDGVQVAAGQGSVTDDSGRPRPAVTLLPAPVPDAAAALQERLVTRFRIAPITGASRYRAQVATDREFRQGIADGEFREPEIKFGDLPDGDYFLRARAVDALGLEGSDTVFAFRLKARPEPPLATAPAPNGKVRDTTATLEWTANPQAIEYRVQIAEDEAFTRVVREANAAGTTFDTGTLPFGDYYWRLRSVRNTDKGADLGPWGDVRKFSLRPPPRNPDPPQESGNGLAFAWSGEPGQTFLFQVARDARFTDLVEARQLKEPNTLIPRPAQGTYYLRLRATDPDGFVGPFTAPQRFSVINRIIDTGGANITTGEGNPVRLQ